MPLAVIKIILPKLRKTETNATLKFNNKGAALSTALFFLFLGTKHRVRYFYYRRGEKYVK